jgi:hypothetical protein
VNEITRVSAFTDVSAADLTTISVWFWATLCSGKDVKQVASAMIENSFFTLIF